MAMSDLIAVLLILVFVLVAILAGLLILVFVLIALSSEQPEIVRCKDCEYGEQDEVERWFCRSLGCQIGNEDGSGYCADALNRKERGMSNVGQFCFGIKALIEKCRAGENVVFFSVEDEEEG